jgi:hypothetical protein
MASTGITESKRYLSKLSERTFLRFWSYSNLYNGKGQELCDLLVVCGDHILIFSDKHIVWPENTKNINIAWNRWYRKAIKDSVNQVNGATRWIEQFPDKIFLDPKCTKPFPLSLPAREKRKLQGIVVARGIKNACKKFYNGGSGSLKFSTSFRGDGHFKTNHVDDPRIFSIGDVNPSGSFIHVLDEVTLDIIMMELDTILNFTHYLDKKTIFIRSGRLLIAAGKEDILSWYLRILNNEGEYDFIRKGEKEIDILGIDEGFYQEMLSSPEYKRKKRTRFHISGTI